MKKYIFNSNALNWLIILPCIVMANIFIDISLVISLCFILAAASFAPRKSKTNEDDALYFYLTLLTILITLTIAIINMNFVISLSYLGIIALLIYNNQNLKYVEKTIKFVKNKTQKNKASE